LASEGTAARRTEGCARRQRASTGRTECHSESPWFIKSDGSEKQFGCGYKAEAS
jgi:hypothetical protein